MKISDLKTLQKLSIISGLLSTGGAMVMTLVYGFTIGNAIALCIGAVLLVLGFWFYRFPPSFRKAIIVMVSAGVTYFVVITAVVIISGARTTVSYDEDCILVLGCGIRGETVLPTLQARLDKCLEYHAVNPDALIIVSGGQGAREDISEAEAMKRYLVRNGISEGRIMMEDQSRNTKDNFLYSKQLLDRYYQGQTYTIACITSDYHVFRTRQTARQSGWDIHTLSAGVKWYLRPSAYCREALSILKFWIFGVDN